MTLNQLFRLLFAFSFVALFAYAVWEAWFGFGQVSRRAGLYPLVIGIGALGLALVTFTLELRKLTSQKETAIVEPDQDSPLASAGEGRRTAAIMVWIIGFFLAIWLLGFIIAAPLSILLYLKLEAREKWPISIILAAGGWLFFGRVFDCTLHVPFPEGLLPSRLEELVGVNLPSIFRVPLIC